MSTATGAQEAPVFLDESGRRGRVVRWVTRGLAALMPAWLAAVVIGALTPLSLPAVSASVHAAVRPMGTAVTTPGSEPTARVERIAQNRSEANGTKAERARAARSARIRS